MTDYLRSNSLTLIGQEGGARSRIDAQLKTSLPTGEPNDNFRKISVRKTIRDLEFSEHLL